MVKKRGKVGAAAPQLSVLASFSFDYSFVFFLLIIPTYDLVLHFFVSSHSYTLDFFRFATFFPSSFLLDLFDPFMVYVLQATWKSPCLEGGTWSSGSLPTSPAISRDVSRDTSVDRRSCCRQTRITS